MDFTQQPRTCRKAVLVRIVFALGGANGEFSTLAVDKTVKSLLAHAPAHLQTVGPSAAGSYIEEQAKTP